MLSAEAHAILAEQIEALSPSAAVLESKGVDWETAATLARFIKTGAPDVIALKEHGLPLGQSVEICEAISKRHARRAAALAKPPLLLPAPKPEPVAAAPAAAEALDAWTAMSRLHTFCEQLESGSAACLSQLVEDGWSEPTAREIVKTINAARPVNVRANGMPGFQRRATDRK
jgi:hypothetical protein